MNDKAFKLSIAVIILIIATMVIFKGGGNEVALQLSNHTYGNTESTVELIEYGDFQCPACLRYYPSVKQVKEKYKDQILFKFRNFPLTQLHQNTIPAHRAAEAASNQGKFWEMHNMLYDNQKVWSQSQSPGDLMKEYAQALDLDLTKFDEDRASLAVMDVINADSKSGTRIGARGTPTFTLNGKMIENPEPTLEAFSVVIDQALSEQTNN